MRAPSLRRYRLVAYTLAAALASVVPLSAQSQASVTLELRPHCEEEEVENAFGGPVPDNPFMTTPTTGSCDAFSVRDPQTRETTPLSTGDTLDMDLVVRNPTSALVTRVRAWLAYDPNALLGESIEIDPSFSMPSPDEQSFSPLEGYAKVSASTDQTLTKPTIVVARIRMRVKAATGGQTVISFYNASSDPKSETAVLTVEGTEERGLLSPPLGSLLVQLLPSSGQEEHTAATASEASSSSVASSVPSVPPLPTVSSVAQASSASSAAESVFTLLQVQNVRLTTDGTVLYVAWDPLKSTELIGYNVYYSAVSGRYLQRRSVDRTATTLTIRDLPEDVRMYVAIRGVNGENEETEFSQEAAVVIGKPETSTAPLLGSALRQGPHGIAPRTSGNIAGETGASSTVLLFVLLSATIGTILALRRQLRAIIRQP